MLIRWQDRDYDLDLTDFTLKQAEAIQAATGLPLGKWLDALNESFDQDSPQFLPFMRVLYWLMINQAGDRTPISAVDFPLGKFGQAFMAGMAAEENGRPVEDVALPDPTQLPGASAPSPALSSPSTQTIPAGSPDG